MVDVLHHRVNHALGMNDDFNLRGIHPKQELRFDDFQGFVHHGGGIDRYFLTHAPIGMGTGLLGGHMFQGLWVTGPEWTARSRQNDLVNHITPNLGVLGQGLKNGGVFAVNGQKCGATRFDCSHEETAPHHQSFFIGQ